MVFICVLKLNKNCPKCKTKMYKEWRLAICPKCGEVEELYQVPKLYKRVKKWRTITLTP